MKTVALFGQGNGYGDGKVYVCLETESDLFKMNATFGKSEITRNAREAFKFGGGRGCYTNGLPDFTYHACPLTLFYSKRVQKHFGVESTKYVENVNKPPRF